MKFTLDHRYLDFVTRPWRRTLTNGSDVKCVFTWFRDESYEVHVLPFQTPSIRMGNLVSSAFSSLVAGREKTTKLEKALGTRLSP